MPVYALTIQTISTLLVSIRFLSRVNGTGGKFGFDDVCIAIAWAIATVNIGLIVKCMFMLSVSPQYHANIDPVSYSFGLDRHIWDVPPYEWSKGAEVS